MTARPSNYDSLRSVVESCDKPDKAAQNADWWENRLSEVEGSALALSWPSRLIHVQAMRDLWVWRAQTLRWTA